MLAGALWSGDEDVGAARVELDGEDLFAAAGTYFHGAVVLFVEAIFYLVEEILGD